MIKIIHRVKFKTYTLFAVDRVSKDHIFVLSVDASNLKSAKEFAKGRIFNLAREYPYYHYDFVWEQQSV